MKTKKSMAICVLCLLAVGVGLGWKSNGVKGNELLGITLEEAIELLGVPDSLNSSTWDYGYSRKNAEGRCEELMKFHDGLSYWVKPGLTLPKHPKPPPSEGVYVGQKVNDMVKRIGQPQEMFYGGASIGLHFNDGKKISIAHGYVAYISD